MDKSVTAYGISQTSHLPKCFSKRNIIITFALNLKHPCANRGGGCIGVFQVARSRVKLGVKVGIARGAKLRNFALTSGNDATIRCRFPFQAN